MHISTRAFVRFLPAYLHTHPNLRVKYTLHCTHRALGWQSHLLRRCRNGRTTALLLLLLPTYTASRQRASRAQCQLALEGDSQAFARAGIANKEAVKSCTGSFDICARRQSSGGGGGSVQRRIARCKRRPSLHKR